MTILKYILLVLGFVFIIFGYKIYFKKKYNLINGFEEEYKTGRKTESYAKMVGIIELILGIILTIAGLILNNIM